MSRRAAALGCWLVSASLLGGCAGLSLGDSKPEPLPEAQARRPEWQVGDAWIFSRRTVAGAVRIVTHAVVAAGPDGYTMRITGLGPDITRVWTRDLHLVRQESHGTLLQSFEPPAPYFSWPLRLGARWSHAFEYRDGRNDGRYLNHWRVGERTAPVAVLAGSFVAVRLEQLDRQEGPLQTYWYAPGVRYWVKLESYGDGYVDELMEQRSP